MPNLVSMVVGWREGSLGKVYWGRKRENTAGPSVKMGRKGALKWEDSGQKKSGGPKLLPVLERTVGKGQSQGTRKEKSDHNAK